jgi:hypothetical protein
VNDDQRGAWRDWKTNELQIKPSGAIVCPAKKNSWNNIINKSIDILGIIEGNTNFLKKEKISNLKDLFSFLGLNKRIRK